MTRFAERKDVEREAESWDLAVLECRTYGHNWKAHDAKHFPRLRYYRVSQVCGRCSTLRFQELSETGEIFASWLKYREGYLSSVGRIAGPERGVLRIAAVVRTGGLETVRSKVSEDDLPRSSRTPVEARLRAVG